MQTGKLGHRAEVTRRNPGRPAYRVGEADELAMTAGWVGSDPVPPDPEWFSLGGDV